jgi:hypothetical protein
MKNADNLFSKNHPYRSEEVYLSGYAAHIASDTPDYLDFSPSYVRGTSSYPPTPETLYLVYLDLPR